MIIETKENQILSISNRLNGLYLELLFEYLIIRTYETIAELESDMLVHFSKSLF